MRPVQVSDRTRRVWDPFVRVFHWTVVGCVLLNCFAWEKGEWPHEWTGCLASAMVVARIAWGFIGSRHARFSDLFPSPSRVMTHLRATRQGEALLHWGHNPLGAVMMLLPMALVLALGLTGWMQGTDTDFGKHWLQDLHEFLANALIASAGLHAAAALVMGRIERTRLVKAMVTGVKERC
jgi:cytochrome b